MTIQIASIAPHYTAQHDPQPNSRKPNSRQTVTNRSTTLALAILTSIALATGCKTAAPTGDAALTSAVQTRITSDTALATEPILPTVQNGVATLNGAVSSEAARSLAANDAAQVPGIRTVVNNLTVATQQAKVVPPPAPTATVPPAPAPTPLKPVAKAVPALAPKLAPKPAKTTPARSSVSQYGGNPPPSPQDAPIERPLPTAPVVAAAPLPPPPPAFRSVTIPADTTIPVRITETLDSATTQQGENFTGTVATDIIIDGLVAIPQGTPVTGRVTAVQEAAHYKGSSLLSIELTNINRKGERIPVTTEAFSKEGAGRGKNTAAKVGGGAAVGAILGGILGGGKGAAIGAAAGGGVGAGANTITKGQQVQITSETLIRFRLSTSIAIRASTRDAAVRNTDTNSDINTDRRPLTPPQ